jgi:hypothetical protein
MLSSVWLAAGTLYMVTLILQKAQRMGEHWAHTHAWAGAGPLSQSQTGGTWLCLGEALIPGIRSR